MSDNMDDEFDMPTRCDSKTGTIQCVLIVGHEEEHQGWGNHNIPKMWTNRCDSTITVLGNKVRCEQPHNHTFGRTDQVHRAWLEREDDKYNKAWIEWSR